MRHGTITFVSIAALTLGGCFGSDDPATTIDEGFSALSSGDYEEAVSDFERALEQLDEEAEREGVLEARLGRLRALCYVDAPSVRGQLASVADANELTPADYSQIVSELVASAGEQYHVDEARCRATIEEAVAVLEDGSERFPDYPKWAGMIESTGRRAESFGAEDALERLGGLGYVNTKD